MTEITDVPAADDRPDPSDPSDAAAEAAEAAEVAAVPAIAAVDVQLDGPDPDQDPAPDPAEDTEDAYSLFDEDEPSDDLTGRTFPRHRVLAVLVAHDGLRWIDRALDAVAGQTRPAQRFHVADTGSTDGTAERLAERFGPGVVTLPRDSGFGAAVAQVLEVDARAPGLPSAEPGVPGEATTPVVDWVWLLHDDCAPAPDALHHLLAAVDTMPSVAVAGPKILGWADPRHLLEAGVTIARSGARETGLERQEQDQGQHDVQRSTLAVSTAGMLVRRDVWDALGGLDPRLPLFRDDIDLGWRVNAAGHRVVVVPDAVVHHAEAASHRRRRISVGPDQPHRLDRYHAMQVLLANMPAWLLPWLVVRLTVGTLLRSVGFLIAKDPGFALAEVRALGTTLAHPGALRAARRSRRATATVGYGDLRGLLAAPGTQLRHGVDVLAGAFAGDARRPARVGATFPPLGDGEDEDGPTDLLAGADSLVGRTLRRPGVALALVALVLALLAERALLGHGWLLGGTLLPATDGASDLWSTYTSWWHGVGLGSGTPAAGYAPVVAVGSLVLLGKVGLLVDVLLLLCVPLAATTAYLALRSLTSSVVLRLWAAAAYALLPAATGAVASGRLGTALVLVLLPLLARPALRVGGVVGPAPTWRTAWGTGLLLALLSAFVPILWVLALVLGIAAAATTARGRWSAGRLAAALVVAPVVLLPWSWQLVLHPSYLLVEGGVLTPSTVSPDADPLAVLLLAPGGPGVPPSWVGLGIVLAAIAAVVRGVRRQAVSVASVIALTALAFAILVARTSVRTPQVVAGVPGWSGALLVVAGAALVVAAVLAADGARSMLAERSFGWRQPVAVAVVLLCVLGPLAAAVGWVVRGAEGPVRRGPVSLLPAFAVADTATRSAPRTLALRAEGSGLVSFSVLRGEGARLGDAEVAPPADAAPQLRTVVSDLASGRGGVSGSSLVGYGVRYVVVGEVGAPGARDLVRSLDGTPGLRRLSSADDDAVWRVVGITGAVRLVPDRGLPVVVPSGGSSFGATLPNGWRGGTLELAETVDRGWTAKLDGRSLRGVVVDGWSQGFVVPAGAGRLEVSYSNPARSRWLALQGVAIVVAVVLALPARRRDGEGEDA